MEKVKEYLEKAKNRVIHEFEYQNGKYIQHYVLGGEHELTPQDIVDCLNALATMDCDLQTAYAYIKGQDEKSKQLEENLIEMEHSKLRWENLWFEQDKEIKALKEQLARVRKQVCGEIKSKLQLEIIQIDDGLHNYSQDVIYWQDICSVIEKVEAKENIDGKQDN